MAIFCIGDIHGKFDRFASQLEQLPLGATAICVGDIGLGFPDTKSPHCLDTPDKIARERNQTIWLVRGNHDDPDIWNFSRYAWNDHLTNIRIPPDIHRMIVENSHIVMIGGAISLDRGHPDRIDGENWWSNEAVSPAALTSAERLVNSYGKADLLVTHVGPLEAHPGMERDEESFAYYSNIDPPLRADVKQERQLISQIVKTCAPKQVAFGHYHVPEETEINRTKYRCCAELEVWQYAKKTYSPPLPTA